MEGAASTLFMLAEEAGRRCTYLRNNSAVAFIKHPSAITGRQLGLIRRQQPVKLVAFVIAFAPVYAKPLTAAE